MYFIFYDAHQNVKSKQKNTSNDLPMTFQNDFQNTFAALEWFYQIPHIKTL
jgi:hypothetical protein